MQIWRSLNSREMYFLTWDIRELHDPLILSNARNVSPVKAGNLAWTDISRAIFTVNSLVLFLPYILVCFRQFHGFHDNFYMHPKHLSISFR